MRSIRDRIAEKVQQRSVAAGLSQRSDLFVSDHQPITPRQCKLLIGYAEGMEVPSIKNVENYIQNTYGNKLTAQTASMKSFPESHAVSVVVTLQEPTRSLADASEMVRVSANSYMDPNTDNLWEVVDNGNAKFLVRQSADDISAIVEARKTMRSSRKEAKFSTLKQAAPMLSVGDHVQFLSGQGVVLRGEITSISGNRVTISANKQSHTVDKGAVFGVDERSQKAVKEDKAILEDYWSKAFGDRAYGKKLVR